jgi:predicted transcriptional regulator
MRHTGDAAAARAETACHVIKSTLYIHHSMRHLFVVFMAQVACTRAGCPYINKHEETKMDDFLKEAFDIVKAQASVRAMTEEEMLSMVRKLASGFSGLTSAADVAGNEVKDVDAAKSIKEKSVTCLECGKVFKVLSRKHLASHGLAAEEYKAKWGFKPKTALVAKGLQRERRKKMQEMKLWERRKKA